MSGNQWQLLQYFGTIFPAETICDWLSYGVPALNLHQRELSFWMDGDKIVQRFKSFKDAKSLRDHLTRNKQLIVERMEIGAVYNTDPRRKETAKLFQTISKELVFDIDMTDYDNVRQCCKDKKVCNQCWPLIICAVEVIHRILEEDFGYTQLMNVFSGRRGIHIWCCDQNARNLTDEQRGALVKYMSIAESGIGTVPALDKKSMFGLREGKLHLTMQNILSSIISPTFATIYLSEGNPNNMRNPLTRKLVIETIVSQNVFKDNRTPADQKNQKALLTLFGMDKDVNQPTAELGNKNLIEFWEKARAVLAKMFKYGHTCEWVLDYVELSFMYPRLDIAVTKRKDHLLKSPFVVHPATGKVCVPLFTLESVRQFNPDNAITLEDVLAGGESELSEYLSDFKDFCKRTSEVKPETAPSQTFD